MLILRYTGLALEDTPHGKPRVELDWPRPGYPQTTTLPQCRKQLSSLASVEYFRNESWRAKLALLVSLRISGDRPDRV